MDGRGPAHVCGSHRLAVAAVLGLLIEMRISERISFLPEPIRSVLRISASQGRVSVLRGEQRRAVRDGRRMCRAPNRRTTARRIQLSAVRRYNLGQGTHRDGRRGTLGSRVTIRDIAKRVGLSTAAVSLVLNDKPCRISEENRQRIKSVAAELNYVPNYTARNLKMKRTMTIGLIVPNIASHFYSAVAKALEGECRRHGYALFIAGTKGRVENDIELLEMFSERGTDGLFLVSSSRAVGNPEFMQAIRDLQMSVCLVVRYMPGIERDAARFDESGAAYCATKHLLEKGHRKIGLVANIATSNSGLLRCVGYERALSEAGIPLDWRYVAQSDYVFREAYEATDRLLDTDVTAILATSDTLAFGAYKSISDRGLSVPGDISLMGFDSGAASDICSVDLTLMERDISDLARRAADLLCTRIDRRAANLPDTDPVSEVIMPWLHEGESVADLRGRA